ncbi:MAG: TIGR03936 family radical SAM-associated protein [Anaerolineaceae bacterium]|jgi:radical SAM-linked protein|nr:TIGR03936 family radical SAM-associated protein [Anaerolineaceae bacterium]MDD4042056.1 TIGR03936 family radical SAM-associated protein [Anaerolineaceae bacterium]MDD4578034.1 TIGR03936 family radical SAM-associated protein [Anaerolineaceae bacterium]
MNNIPVRIRVRYSKVGNLRFIGHLDTQRLFERALRRSGLPLRYTQGFKKHIRLNLASALPLGFISTAELLDFWLGEPIEEQEIWQRLQSALPLEIRINDLKQVENVLPSLQASLLSSEYKITLPKLVTSEQFQQKLEQLLAQPGIPISRRDKTIDYKPLILGYSISTEESVVNLRLSSTPTGNARPDDLLQLLGIDPANCMIERVGLNF